jgi:hypothetical protein
VERRLLAIYLNDHLAGAISGLELARRARGSNQGTELGDFLDALGREIEADRESLERIMDELGIGRDRVKIAAAWGAEKFGRLKLNGSLLSYSPLSRVVELDALHLGLTGKLILWRGLEDAIGPQLGGEDLGALQQRAERQRAELEPFRLAAARQAFGEEAIVSPRSASQ